MSWMSGSECTVLPTSTVQLTVAGGTRAWVSAENVLGIEEDVERQTLFRVGHYVHRGYGDASRWVVYFRVYGPVKAGFDGSWKPGDFEEVK